MQRAQRQMRPERPLRFYDKAAVATVPDGYTVLLDGRPVRTPGKRALAVPTMALAEAIADEWRRQGHRIDPASMSQTRLANSVIDAVVQRMAEVRADALKYAGTDLICYRAEHPVELVALQRAHWDPILAWAWQALGAAFLTAGGIAHRAQPQSALDAVGRRLDALDAFRLAAVHELTTLSGSVLIALAVLDGRLASDAAWAAAHVDEDWQIRHWGEDFEAAERWRRRRRDFDAAARLIRLVSPE
jgi:chaperone required for assembly of F1-ATPase